MNMPDRKSRTRFCAPKPTATPTMPAEARIGPRATPNTSSTMIAAIVSTITEIVERSTEPIVRARWVRRAGPVGVVGSGRPGNRPSRALAAPSTMRWTSRCSSNRPTNATTTISAIWTLPPTMASAERARKSLLVHS
jgi:hypothetical protein